MAKQDAIKGMPALSVPGEVTSKGEKEKIHLIRLDEDVFAYLNTLKKAGKLKMGKKVFVSQILRNVLVSNYGMESPEQ